MNFLKALKTKFKNFMASKLNKRLMLAVVILGIMNLLQLFYVDVISFNNVHIDLVFRYTGPCLFHIICFIVMFLVIINAQINGVRIFFQVIIIPTAFVLLFLIILTVPVVTTSENEIVKYYFKKSKGYNYYIINESFAAPKPYESLQIYKEQPLNSFMHKRVNVQPYELNLDMFSIQNLYDRLSESSNKE